MNTPNEQAKEGVAQTEAQPNQSRRRLVQGGAGAAPLLMTLISRPVLGQVTCQSTSAAMSMPTSHAHGQLPVCSGGSPTFWSQPENFNQWPAGYYPVGSAGPVSLASAGDTATLGGVVGHEATLFAPHFLPSPYPPETTLLAVLKKRGQPHSVARHLAAARLNVASGLVPVLNEATIQTIWLEYTSKGYFEPTAGVKWYAPEIVDYLATTETK
jgi:hypothetical protein